MRFIVDIFYTLGQAVALRGGDSRLISRNEGHFEVVQGWLLNELRICQVFGLV